MDICVGNLPGDVTARDLREIFESFGRVEAVNMTRSRQGKESKGLGFVGMPARVEAVSAVLAVHGKMVNGQALTANEVQPRGPVSGVGGTRCPCRSENATSDNTCHISAEFPGPGAGHDAGNGGGGDYRRLSDDAHWNVSKEAIRANR